MTNDQLDYILRIQEFRRTGIISFSTSSLKYLERLIINTSKKYYHYTVIDLNLNTYNDLDRIANAIGLPVSNFRSQVRILPKHRNVFIEEVLLHIRKLVERVLDRNIRYDNNKILEVFNAYDKKFEYFDLELVKYYEDIDFYQYKKTVQKYLIYFKYKEAGNFVKIETEQDYHYYRLMPCLILMCKNKSYYIKALIRNSRDTEYIPHCAPSNAETGLYFKGYKLIENKEDQLEIFSFNTGHLCTNDRPALISLVPELELGDLEEKVYLVEAYLLQYYMFFKEESMSGVPYRQIINKEKLAIIVDKINDNTPISYFDDAILNYNKRKYRNKKDLPEILVKEIKANINVDINTLIKIPQRPNVRKPSQYVVFPTRKEYRIYFCAETIPKIKKQLENLLFKEENYIPEFRVEGSSIVYYKNKNSGALISQDFIDKIKVKFQ